MILLSGEGMFSNLRDREDGLDISQVVHIAREPQSLRRLKILFVDSDLNTYEKMQRALGNGFIVQHVASVTEAIEILKTSVPDILISEVNMGQENGLDLCRYVRGKTMLHYLPIMLLTSLTTTQDKIAGFNAGADDYVVKPFDAHHLQARIRLLSRIKRLERHAEV
jgi:DNA-binding response OmpR family regulator